MDTYMLNLTQLQLSGRHVCLETLNESHRDELYAAAQDERIWTYNSSKAFGDRFDDWFNKALENLVHAKQHPFVVRRLTDNQILGSTRFYDINHAHRRLTIGYTWYVVHVWGTVVNPESKLLILSHAFDMMNINRVELIADSRNSRSRAAIKKLGAIEEGILRQHMIVEDEFVRDSVVHSIIKADWPDIKKRLESRIEG
jgi:RimJ/RimL family protein N-acetyltransferase